MNSVIYTADGAMLLTASTDASVKVCARYRPLRSSARGIEAAAGLVGARAAAHVHERQGRTGRLAVSACLAFCVVSCLWRGKGSPQHALVLVTSATAPMPRHLLAWLSWRRRLRECAF